METTYCSKCGTKNSKDASFCGNCGEKISPVPIEKNHCPGCGYVANEDEKYCPECGTELTSTKSEEKTPKSQPKAEAKKKSKPATKTTITPPVKKKKGRFLRTLGKAALWVFGIVILGVVALYFIGDIDDESINNSDTYNDELEYRKKEQNTPSYPKPRQGELLAEKVLTPEDLTLDYEPDNVRMTVSPLCINETTPAQIHRIKILSPFENILMNGYDFNVGKGGQMDGVVRIEIPYSENEIAAGYTAKQCISAAHYNDEKGIFENVNYHIDTENKKLVILATELSGNFKINNLTPNESPIANGTPNLGSSQVFTSNDSWESPGDWGIFYTSNKGDLLEWAYKYNFDAAKWIFREYGSKALSEKITKYGLKNPDKVNIDATLSLFGKIGYIEHSGNLILASGGGVAVDNVLKNMGFTGASLKKITSTLSHIGMVLAGVQLYYDLQHGNDHAAFKVLKNFVYWQGIYMGKYSASVFFTPAYFGAATTAATVGGTVAAVALAALFISEGMIGPLETWNDNQYSKMPEHQKLFSAYNKYYMNSDGLEYRPYKEWLKIIVELNKKALSVQKADRASYFEKLLKEEITNYTNLFWTKLTEEQRIDLVINSPFGYSYGGWGALHYAGNKKDKEKNLSVYLDEIADGKYPSMNLTWVERELVSRNTNIATRISYSSNKRMARQYLSAMSKSEDIKKELSRSMYNYLMEERVKKLMQHQSERMYLLEEKALRANLDALSNDLNSVIKISVIDKSEKLEGKKPFANFILVPKSEPLTQSGNMDQWKITLDKEGKGRLTFTTLAYIKSGGFKELEVYIPGTKDFTSKNKKGLVKVVGFTIDEDNNARVELKEDYSDIKFYQLFNGDKPTENVYAFTKGYIVMGHWKQVKMYYEDGIYLDKTEIMFGYYKYDAKTKAYYGDLGEDGLFTAKVIGDKIDIYNEQGEFFSNGRLLTEEHPFVLKKPKKKESDANSESGEYQISPIMPDGDDG